MIALGEVLTDMAAQRKELNAGRMWNGQGLGSRKELMRALHWSGSLRSVASGPSS